MKKSLKINYFSLTLNHLPLTIFFITILQLFSSSPAIAQTTIIDSLNAVLGSTVLGSTEAQFGRHNVPSLHDTTRISTLNALAWEYKFINPDTSFTISQQALEFAEKIKWEKGKSKSLNNIGDFYSEKGKYSLALSYYSQALTSKNVINDKRGTAITLGKIGGIYYEQSDYQKALQHFFMAYDIAQQLGDKSVMAVDLNNIGLICTEQGNYPEALEHYFKAMEIAKDLKDKKGIAIKLGNIGLVYYSKGDYPNALQHYFNAYEMDKVLENKKGMARHLSNIGLVYSAKGEYPNALQYYFKALEISQEIGDKSGISSRLLNIGAAYGYQGNYPNALQSYFQALEIAQELGNKSGIGTNLGNIGGIYNAQGNFSKALQHYFKALKIAEELGEKSNISTWYSNIGTFYFEQKCYGDAEKFLNKSLDLAVEIGYLDNIKGGHKNLSKLYFSAPQNATVEGRKICGGNSRGCLVMYSLAVEHYENYLKVSDTVFNEEKSVSMGKMEARHEFALMEIEREKEEKERQWQLAVAVKHRDAVQYSIIYSVLAVIVLITILVLFAKFRVHEHIKTGAVFITLLMLFEFVLLLTDIRIENLTSGDPVFKLGINAVLAIGFYFAQVYLLKLLPVKTLQKINRDNTSGNMNVLLFFCISSFVLLSAFASLQKNDDSHQSSVGTTHIVTTDFSPLDSLKTLLANYQNQITELRSKNKQKEVYETYQKFSVVKDSLQQLEQTQEFSKIDAKQALEKKQVEENIKAEEMAKIETARKNRNNNLKYSFITILIILFFIFIIVFNYKSKFVNRKFLEGGLFVSFLLLFEFLTVLADPYIEQYTGGAPAWKLGFNTVIAICIFPVHAWLEGKIRKKLFMHNDMPIIQNKK